MSTEADAGCGGNTSITFTELPGLNINTEEPPGGFDTSHGMNEPQTPTGDTEQDDCSWDRKKDHILANLESVTLPTSMPVWDILALNLLPKKHHERPLNQGQDIKVDTSKNLTHMEPQPITSGEDPDP